MNFATLKGLTIPEGNVKSISIGGQIIWQAPSGSKIWYDFGTLNGDIDMPMPDDIPELEVGRNYIVYVDDVAYEVTATTAYGGIKISLYEELKFEITYMPTAGNFLSTAGLIGEHTLRIEYAD